MYQKLIHFFKKLIIDFKLHQLKNKHIHNEEHNLFL
jgi:hypothetical protein